MMEASEKSTYFALLTAGFFTFDRSWDLFTNLS